ncbi:MAG: hypothetical protein ABGW78_00930 [Pirellulales bacterium]
MTEEAHANHQDRNRDHIGLDRLPEFKLVRRSLNQLVRGNLGVSAASGIPPRLHGY